MEDMFYASKLGNKTIEDIFETSDEDLRSHEGRTTILFRASIKKL